MFSIRWWSSCLVSIHHRRNVLATESAGKEWIIKFAATNDPVDFGPLDEAYARMARAAGIGMAETRMIPSTTGPGHFATKRFDRPVPVKQLHMVSLGGALEASSLMPSVDRRWPPLSGKPT
ncbi:HipA domain-containing protein [Novosphingobium sp. ES2-1]|uniref:HipA domain-containing protein n=1 Tax=Novosphingobium sp. ES2-1 TaxID=2780074 RepID=UPI0018830E0F|nr:HipA domain-containing protein [Novosphingobium sp. ES2-1]QOV96167.1 HipA domain-containing protein [Novosphingobium sp. ES2-1]